MTLWELADKQPILALFAVVCGSGVLALAVFAFSSAVQSVTRKKSDRDDDDPPAGAGGGEAEQPS